MSFAIARLFESFGTVCEKIVGQGRAISEGQNVVNVIAENDDTAFVRAVFVDAITFGNVWQCVKDGRKSVWRFAGLGVRDDFDEDTFIGIELGESASEAD